MKRAGINVAPDRSLGLTAFLDFSGKKDTIGVEDVVNRSPGETYTAAAGRDYLALM